MTFRYFFAKKYLKVIQNQFPKPLLEILSRQIWRFLFLIFTIIMAKKKSKTKEREIVKAELKPRAQTTAPRLRKRLKDAQETQRFFLVVAIATLVLVFLLFLIFVGK